MASIWPGAVRAQNVGTFHHEKKLGPVLADGESERQKGANDRWQHETLYRKSSSSSGTATICVFEVCSCAEHSSRGSQAIGTIIGKNLGKRHAQHMGKCEGKSMLQDESGLSIAQDTLWESTDFLRRITAPVDDMARCHLVIRVSSFVSAPRLETAFGGSLLGMERSSETGGVCSLCRPARLECPKT